MADKKKLPAIVSRERFQIYTPDEEEYLIYHNLNNDKTYMSTRFKLNVASL